MLSRTATTQTPPTRVTWQRVVLGLIIIAIVAFAGEELRPRLPKIESWIGEQGAWAPILFIVLMALLSVFCFPLDVLFIAGGLIFNLEKGSLYVAAGIYLGQSIDFWLGRTLLRTRVEKWVVKKPKLRGIHGALRSEGLKLLLMLRLAPIPASPTSYLMGTTPMPFWHFLVATLGLLPVAYASMYFGYAAVHATKTVDNPHHIFSWHDASIFGGLILAIGVMTLIGHQAHRMIRNIEKTDNEPDEELA